MSKYLLSLDTVNGLSPCREHEIFNAIIKNSYIFKKIENGLLQLRKKTQLFLLFEKNTKYCKENIKPLLELYFPIFKS